MSIEQHAFIAKRTSPVVDRPIAGTRDMAHLWAYIDWLERCAWSAYTQLDDARKDRDNDRRSRDLSYKRWIVAYTRHKAMRATLTELLAADDAAWKEGMTDATEA